MSAKFKSINRQKFYSWGSRLLILAIFFIFAGFFGIIGILGYVSKSLPSPDKLSSRPGELSTKIFDRNGKLLYDVYGEKNRTLVKLEDVSPWLVKATLATEDAEFYIHKGFDLPGIARGFINTLSGQGLQGGSTITQQLVKNSLLTTERTIPRKIKEFILALQIERTYSKDEILQMYLNSVPYGGQAWGIETASEMYFGKSAKDLTIGESTLLAGLPQRPSYYSPFGSNPENAKNRQSYVIYLMKEKGWIDNSGNHQYLSQTDSEEAKNEELKYSSYGSDIKAPHFVMYVKELLAERYGEDLVEKGGLQVITSLDLEMQETAQKIVAEEVEKAKSLLVGNGALVAMDPRTGQILSMVGSKDYFAEDYDGKYNVALAERQPGSSIKPITYVTAFKQGYTAATMIVDAKTTFAGQPGSPPYTPVNYDGKFRGPLSFRTALANSINVTAVKVLDLVGIPAFLDTAHEIGITTLNNPERYGLALTLGGGEVKPIDMAVAFSTFASGGLRHDPVPLLKVSDSQGKILQEWRETPGKRVLKASQAYLISSILSDNNARSEAFGLYSPLKVGDRQVAVKTGTTDNKKDNWCVGYTPSITVAVWVGNNDGKEMSQSLASGVTGAAPIWHNAMIEFLKKKPMENFERPSDIIEMSVDKISGELPIAGRDTKTEIFVKGTEPKNESSVHKIVKICQPDGKLATSICVKANKYDEKWFVVLKELKPEWQPFTDAWINEHSAEYQNVFPPTEKSKLYFDENGNFSESGVPLVEFTNHRNEDTVPSTFSISVTAYAPYAIESLKFYLDDVMIGQISGNGSDKLSGEKEFNVSGGLSGKHSVKVTATDSSGRSGDRVIEVKIQ